MKESPIFVVKWHDNSIVSPASICLGIEPQHQVSRYSQKEKKRVKVSQPHLIQQYNKYMGRVDRSDQNMGLYRVSVRGKIGTFHLCLIALTQQKIMPGSFTDVSEVN